jgi:UDP-N-acetylglucosamine:LPS N-acetylglucosamine transferase
MAASDLVICNAGLSTLTEIAQRAPTPTITSPLGSHWEQEDCARTAVRAGYAVSISRSRLTPATLAREAIDIVKDPARWQRMAQAARATPHTNGARLAAQAIADLLQHR